MKELIERIKEKHPCSEGLKWLEEQKSKEDILNNCPEDWKIWAIQNGILDFVDYLNYEELSRDGWNTANVIRAQPQLINKFDLNKISVYQIYYVLLNHPRFINSSDLDKINGYNISCLLSIRPQFIDKFDLSKLNGEDISWVLRLQPQFIDKFDLSKLNGDDISRLLSDQPKLKPYFDKKDK
jgi:Fe-S cluster biosynthesis and repair protein YggX